MRHEKRFRDHPRAGLQWRNFDRLDAQQRQAIDAQARELSARLTD